MSTIEKESEKEPEKKSEQELEKEQEKNSEQESEQEQEQEPEKNFFKKKSGLEKVIGVGFLVFVTILFSIGQFLMIELFFGKVFWHYSAELILKNLFLYGFVNLLIVSLLHNLRHSLMVSTFGFLIVGIANYFVVLFRGYGIVYMDFYAIKTAATVANGYTYSVNRNFVLAAAVGIIMLLLTLFLPKKKNKYFAKKPMLFGGLGIGLCALLCLWMNTSAFFFQDVSGLTWDHQIGIGDYGYILYFTANAGSASVTKPSGYSVEKVDEILSRYKEEESEGNDLDDTITTKNPNLIMIMNEAYSDLGVLGDFKTNRQPMAFYDSLQENTIKGYVQSSVYGGYTANSEFEFLTGCSKAFLPGNPYLQYMDDYLPSLISNIKKQSAYSTATAIHPYNGSGYNRNRVYPLLSFDEFQTIDDFKNVELVRDYVSDMADYKRIEELYEEKDSKSRLCIFNVTMQNHNPYDDYNYDFKEPVRVTSFEAASSVNEYLSLIKLSDDALKELVTYFEKQEEPTVIVLFGDHQPHLPDSFYETVFRKVPTGFGLEETMLKHKVPFLIWANYDIPEETIERTSINYLSSIMLKNIGMPMSNYNRYLLDLWEKIPCFCACGYYDAKGELHELEDSEKEYRQLLKEYEMIQYNYLFDKENRLDEHFSCQ